MAEASGVVEQDIKPTELSLKNIPQTDPEFDNYFKNYSKETHRKNLFNFNRNGAFIFKDGDESKHVIWQFNNRQGEYGKWWDDVSTTPEVTQKVSQDLVGLLTEVKDFYPWSTQVSGFVIVGGAHFGMNPGHGEGMNINYDEIKHLIKARRENDQKKNSEEKVHLAAQMVHELTHLEHDSRGDDSRSMGTGAEEIGPHIPQFLFDPENNHIFNRQLKRALDRLKARRDEGKPKNESGYDWAQYTALLVIADKLAEANPEIKKTLEEDSDPSKIEGLKKVIDLAGSIPEQARKDIAASSMEIANAQILERAKAIEDRLGITSKLV